MLNQQLIDYFKLFKIYDLKKLQKTGQVKIIQDKILMRKILSVEGTVSTQNYTTFNCSNHANIHFRQKYLYMLAYAQPGKAFTFQITYFLSNKQYRLICSTMYKQQFKRKSQNLFHYQIKIPHDKWTVLVFDLYSLINWDNSFKHDQDIRIGFRISNIQIRAHSKVRGMYQSQNLYGPHNLPKQMELPLRGQQSFFDKYAYFVTGLHLTQELKKQIELYKQKALQNKPIQKDGQKSFKKQQKPDNLKPNNSNKQIDQNQQKVKQQKSKNNSRQKIEDQSKSSKSLKKSSMAKNDSSKRSISQNDRRTKNINNHKKQNAQKLNIQQDQDELIQQQVLEPPRPAASIKAKIQSIQALSIVHQNIISCESFIISPIILETHKKITKIYKSRLGKVLTGYVDGSVCLWDLIRKEQLFYFKSQLQELKCLLMDYQQNIIVVGLDKLKRQVIEIVSNDQAIIFKQISTFNIKGLKLIQQESFEMGLISYGYENIRIWNISPNNNIINGYSVYLGKMARNVTYNDCCLVETVAGIYAFISDTEGYVTKININQKKMEGVVKVDNFGIDHIRLIKYIDNQQKILVCNQKGTIKLLSCTTMQSQLQYPLNYRIKSLFFKQNPQNHQVPILLLQTYKKTLAELDLVNSTFHFNIRSHYQQITNIQYEKFSHQNRQSISTLSKENKIITAGLDSTIRIWKIIKVSQTQSVLKQQYEFLINGEVIRHICTSAGGKKGNYFVYIITDSNKLRKISYQSYKIVKEISLNNVLNKDSSTDLAKDNCILSLSINSQGKFLLIVSNNNVLIITQDLEIILLKQINSHKGKKNKINRNQKKYISGFNTYKKSLYYQNPSNNAIQFYSMKDLQNLLFDLYFDIQSQVLHCLQWNNDLIHCLTQTEYHLYQNQNLLKVVPLHTIALNRNLHGNKFSNSNSIQITFITMKYPVVCKCYEVKQTAQNYLEIQIIGKQNTGLYQRIKMPQRITCIKVTPPVKNQQFEHSYALQGEIICSGQSSFGMYVINYELLNVSQKFITEVDIFQQDFAAGEQNKLAISFMNDKTNNVNKNPNFNQKNNDNQIKNNNNFLDTQNLSYISNNKQQNVLDISFSQTATLMMGLQNSQKNVDYKNNQNRLISNGPTQLKKLYEEQQKMFQQCKKAVFGTFFDNQHENQTTQNNQNYAQGQYIASNSVDEQQTGLINMKVFFGVQPYQSLVYEIQSQLLRKQCNKYQSNANQLGQFYWKSQNKIVSFLTNNYKSLLVHQFSQPHIKQKLIHLYSKPTSICWSYEYQNFDSKPSNKLSSHYSPESTRMNYYIVCMNSIIKIYNSVNKLAYIRSIQIDVLIKDKHVIFDSFITNCNTYLVALTYKLDESEQNNNKNSKTSANCYNNTANSQRTTPKSKQLQRKLYIFVIDIASAKIVSSSYRSVKHVKSNKNKYGQYDAIIKQTYSLQVNRYSSNKNLQFVLKGSNQIAFYRVTSMLTLQTLELEEIYNLTKEKTQSLVTCKYIEVENDVYLLIGTQNGSLIVVDSRSGSIVIVLMNLLAQGKNITNNSSITKIQFVQSHVINDNQSQNPQLIPSKLAFFSIGSNTIKIISLQNGLNTLINQLQSNQNNQCTADQSISNMNGMNNLSFTTSMGSLSKNRNKNSFCINLDSQIASISCINNSTQQLVLTKAATLWLVDYDDFCSIKIFSAHQYNINRALFVKSHQNQEQQIENPRYFITASQDGYVKVSDTNKIQQALQIYKPRKNAVSVDISGKYTVCAFKDQVYFYDSLSGSDMKNVRYLGSLQFQNQSVVQVQNIVLSDNYYLLTDKKVYIIYVKSKEQNNILTKSQLSMKSSHSYLMNSNMMKGQNVIQKVLIQIQIRQITTFNNQNQQKNVQSHKSSVSGLLVPISLEINSFLPYDQFSICFKGDKVQTWQRKCLRRTLNPLQQLSKVQQLQYYLIDVYNKKQIFEPCVQFISQKQYMISLSQLNKIQIRSFKQHSIIRQINFSQQSVEGIKCFIYMVVKENLHSKNGKSAQKSNKNMEISNMNYYNFNNINGIKKGPILIIGDKFGYLNICDTNGLIVEKIKVFSSAIEQLDIQKNEDAGCFNILAKSEKFLSLLSIKC